MRVVVAGLGVQGNKRRKFAGADYVASVDPVNPEADYPALAQVPLDQYDAVLACIPDQPKKAMLSYCISHGKHVLVEKPLWTDRDGDLLELERDARKAGVVVYTAYNHRFEPHFIRMRDLIASGELGRIYNCRMFYGNGTARMVQQSAWRDKGAGVLPDLGSHLLDTCRFWFGDVASSFTIMAANSFENAAPDHVVIASEGLTPRIELEMTLLMWRNHFTCDILAENGTAHISSLCKWGPASFVRRTRVLPAGWPSEVKETLTQDDPTWSAEYAHFRSLCARNAPTDLSNDRWLHAILSHLGEQAVERAALR
jgi:predicted dehydrogenase